MRLRTYARVLFLGAFFGFLVNKFVVRPRLLSLVAPAWVETLSYSIPNFFEAVMGMTIVAAGLTTMRDNVERLESVGDRTVYAFAAVLSGVYVITQELGFHSLGGNNVVDSKDVGASIAGLVLMVGLFFRYGLLQQAGGGLPGGGADGESA